MRVQAFPAMDVAPRDVQLATVTPNELRIKSSRNGERRPLQRRRLIEAASKLFSRQGYSRTSLRQIATAAGCEESAIRAEFGAKLALLEEAIRERIADDEVPVEERSSTLEEKICSLMVWQVDRMRRQRHCLEAFLPQDRFNPVVGQLAWRLSLSGSMGILRARLRAPQSCDSELDFLVLAIQAVGLSLGWNGLADRNQVMSKARHVAKVLAGGVQCAHA